MEKDYATHNICQFDTSFQQLAAKTSVNHVRSYVSPHIDPFSHRSVLAMHIDVTTFCDRTVQ